MNIENSKDIYFFKYQKYKKKYLKEKNKIKKIGGKNSNVEEFLTLYKKFSPYLDTINDYSSIIRKLSEMKSVSTTIKTLGLEGYSSVQFGLVVLDSVQILNLINKLNLLLNTNQYQKIFYLLLSTNFDGVNNTEENFNKLSSLIDTLDNKEIFVKKVCKPFNELLIQMGKLVGNTISTAISDDNFTTSKNIQDLIKNALEKKSVEAYEKVIKTINESYNKIPKEFRNFIQNPEEIANVIDNVFKLIKTLKIAFDASRLKIFGKDKFREMIDIILESNNQISDLLNRSISLLYLILNFMKKYCANN